MPASQVRSASGWSLTVSPYSGYRDTFTQDANSAAHVDTSGALGVVEYRFSDFRFAVVGNTGRNHIIYQQILQDTFTTSWGLGGRASADLGPLTFTVGGGFARDTFRSVLQNEIDEWDGSERGVHATVAGRFNFAGPIWLKPLAGIRHLELTQDEHLLASSIIPQETRTSQLLFAGSRVEFVLQDIVGGGTFTPWAFGGFTHEHYDYAPMGPSVFLTEPFVGNQFTLFPTGTTGVPPVFPSRNTHVFGFGLDVDIHKFIIINLAYFREFNNDFGSINYRLSAGIKW